MVAAEGAQRTGDNASAIRDYENAIGLSQGHVAAHVALAKLHLTRQQPAQALPVLERALVLQPTHPEANYLYGKILIGQNRAADAVKAFEAGLARDPGSFDLLNGAGIAHDMLREHARAQRYYQQAIGLRTGADRTMARTNLAMSYLLSNQPKLAVDQLQEEVKQPEVPAVTRHNLALAYGMLGRHAEARKILKKDLTEGERTMALDRLRNYIAYGKPPEADPNTPGGKRP